MNETEFVAATAAVFERIQSAIDDCGLDADTMLAGNVLEIELDDGSKVIVNRHTPSQELWLAAKSGGFHYRWDGQCWRNTRDDSEFYADLVRALHEQGAGRLVFAG